MLQLIHNMKMYNIHYRLYMFELKKKPWQCANEFKLFENGTKWPLGWCKKFLSKYKM